MFLLNDETKSDLVYEIVQEFKFIVIYNYLTTTSLCLFILLKLLRITTRSFCRRFSRQCKMMSSRTVVQDQTKVRPCIPCPSITMNFHLLAHVHIFPTHSISRFLKKNIYLHHLKNKKINSF